MAVRYLIFNAMRYSMQASRRNGEDRPGPLAYLKVLRAGDLFVVWKFDHLGRNLRHLVNTV